MSWTLLKQPIVLQSPLVPLSHSSFPAVFSYRIFNSCSFYYHYYHYHYYKLAVLFSFAQTSPLVLHLTVIFLGCFHWARTECWYVVRWGFFFSFASIDCCLESESDILFVTCGASMTTSTTRRLNICCSLAAIFGTKDKNQQLVTAPA